MASILSKPSNGRVLGQLFEEAGTTKYHELGTTIECEDGTIYMYVIAGEAITGQGYVVQADANGDAEMYDATSGAMNPVHVGICATNGAVADNEYFWMCVRKPASNATLGVRCSASCAADRGLYSSATAGQLDDTSTSHVKLTGIRLLTAVGTAAAAVATASEWNWPQVEEA